MSDYCVPGTRGTKKKMRKAKLFLVKEMEKLQCSSARAGLKANRVTWAVHLAQTEPLGGLPERGRMQWEGAEESDGPGGRAGLGTGTKWGEVQGAQKVGSALRTQLGAQDRAGSEPVK